MINPWDVTTVPGTKRSRNRKHCYIDVDNTLLFPIRESPLCLDESEVIQLGESEFVPHHEHIEKLKVMHSRGFVIIVWSAAGPEWAERVLKALDLELYPDFILGKPDWYIDDRHVEEWMPEVNRIYNEVD